MDIKGKILTVLRGFGFDLRRYDPQSDASYRRNLLLADSGIRLVLDVGANVGQFARQLRRGGYRGRMVSFEPLSVAFRQLSKRADDDADWTTLNIALSDADSTATMNIAGNSASSSLLGMLSAHVESAPDSKYVGEEVVTTRRLDGLIDTLARPDDPVYLKVDTQGTELKVLEGAGVALQRIDTLELELSLVPLYEDAPLFQDMIAWLSGRGYELVGLEAGFSDPRSGRLLQVDGIFHRSRGA